MSAFTGMAYTDMTGLAGGAIALAAAATRLPGAARARQFQRILLMSAVTLAALVPFGALPLAAWLRGAIGDLSVTALVLLGLAIARFLLPAPHDRKTGAFYSVDPENENGRQALLLLIVLAAAGLYPLALGVGLFDPYRLGYGDPWFLGTLMLVALAAGFRRLYLTALCIALAVLAWSGGWHESPNLWDYLLDPLLAIYAAGALVKRNIRSLAK